MRLVSALLFIALTGSVALADEAKPADPKPEVTKSKVPLRVVRLLPETHQVLLHDRTRGTHVVAEVGQEIDGYIVDEIAEDEVTLVAPNGAEVILTAPDMTWRRRAAERKAAAVKAAAAPVAAAEGAVASPEDPYADPAPEVTYDDAGAPVVSAPPAAPAYAPPAPRPTSPAAPAPAAVLAGAATGGTPTAAPTTAPPPASAAPADPYGEMDPGVAAFVDAVGATPAPAPTAPVPAITAPVVAAPAAPAAPAFTVARADVDRALADFGATAVTFDAKFVANGLRIDSIAEGTILARAGLRKGDTITAVDGKPLRSFDDAADLYARMGKARAATIAVQRGGKPVSLTVAIR